jgi:hypothetical protein
MLGKIEKIRADLSDNMLNSGYFITILHKNFGKLSTLLGGGGGGGGQKASSPYAYGKKCIVFKLFRCRFISIA